MDNEPTQEVYIKFPKEEFDNIMRDLKQIIQHPIAELTPSEPVAEMHGRIPAHEFAYQIGVSKTTLQLMINGKHPSGFTLKAFKKQGFKQVWTLQSEVERYFEGFGTPRE